METNMAERLEQAIATLNGLIELAEARGLPESAQCSSPWRSCNCRSTERVTDDEFGTLCDALEGEDLRRATVARRRAALARHRREASCAHAACLAMSAGRARAARRPPACRASDRR